MCFVVTVCIGTGKERVEERIGGEEWQEGVNEFLRADDSFEKLINNSNHLSVNKCGFSKYKTFSIILVLKP